jgi:hypothetical protein
MISISLEVINEMLKIKELNSVIISLAEDVTLQSRLMQ